MLSENTLNLCDNKLLGALSNGKTSQAASKAAKVSALKGRSQRLSGYNEVATTTNGRTTTELVDTKQAAIADQEQSTGLASAASLASTLISGGMVAYEAVSLFAGTKSDSGAVDLMNSELSKETQLADLSDWNSKSLNLQKNGLAASVAKAHQELNEIEQELDQINDMLHKRSLPALLPNGDLNPDYRPNPELNLGDIQTALSNIIDDYEKKNIYRPEQIEELRRQLLAATSEDLDNYETFVINNLIIPYQDNNAALNLIAAQLTGEKIKLPDAPIFDTVFGPPISYGGKFILSEDGIYYDSRTGGIPYIAAEKINAASWQLRYASNKGGKGELYGSNKTGRLANTIFDDDYTNETGEVLNFYKYDDVLRGIENDRNLQVQDVSAKVDDLIATGYATSSAIVKNYKESYAAVGYAYESKIKRRRKQLQVAALFGPFGVTDDKDPVGKGVFYRTSPPKTPRVPPPLCGGPAKSGVVPPGGGDSSAVPTLIMPTVSISAIEYIDRIPLNDFTYLREVGLLPELQQQKSAMLHSSDLDDTTLPLTPAFLAAGPGDSIGAVPEMSIPPIGITDWLNTSGDTDLSGTVPYIRTLDDSIVTDGLIACYNFLQPSAVVDSSSDIFAVKNYSDTGTALDAKLVGGSEASVFLSGVSIPYLTGSLYNPKLKYGLRYAPLPTGSYVRLPNNWRGDRLYAPSQPLDNLMYNENGWSFDFWAHVPGLSSTLTYAHRYKLVVANENCGSGFYGSMQAGANSRITANYGSIIKDGQAQRTNGMIIGFRDRGNPGTPNASGLEFVVLATVSQNDSKWGKSVCIAESVSGDGEGTGCREELGFKVSIDVSTASGYTIADSSGAFTHYAISCDLFSDTITLYVNGQFIASALVSAAFKSLPGRPLDIPTAITEGSFQDKTGLFGERLYRGSKPAFPILTPWILGGGFTDGIAHEAPPIFSSTFPGFLGTNTNDNYYRRAYAPPPGGPLGQHSNLDPVTAADSVPGLGGYSPAVSSYQIARSGLDGHLGSFKIYNIGLNKDEVAYNYKAQKPFFTGIKIPHRIL